MQTPAGWYPDPLGRFDHRYWDGAAWTEHVSRGGQQASDPLTDTQGSAAGEHGPASSTEPTAGTGRSDPPWTVAEPVAADQPPAALATDATTDRATWATPGAETTAPPPQGPGAPPWPPSGAVAAPPYQPGAVPGERRTNVQAVLSLVFSLIWILGLGSLVAIILGALGLRRINASGGRETGKGLAIAGIVIGALGLVSTVLLFVGLAVFARDVGFAVDPDGQVVFDESALFEEDEWARWTALYDTASAQETHWFTYETYTADLEALRAVGLELEPGTQLFVPSATTDAFCIELADDVGIWHLDSDFYEVEEGPCPLG